MSSDCTEELRGWCGDGKSKPLLPQKEYDDIVGRLRCLLSGRCKKETNKDYHIFKRYEVLQIGILTLKTGDGEVAIKTVVTVKSTFDGVKVHEQVGHRGRGPHAEAQRAGNRKCSPSRHQAVHIPLPRMPI